MIRNIAFCLLLLMLSAPAWSEEPADPADGGDKVLSGMSIVGNDEAPKSLVIVPWKSSDLGHTLDVSKALDDGRQPVDRDVFDRQLEYYQIRAESYATSQAQ
jgi:hypothetical protein